MSYSLTTGTSYFEHLQTISAIERSGRRVETAIHSGLMSLATAQAKAMEKLGTRIDDRLVQIDETINSRFSEVKFFLDGISEQLGRGFTAMDARLAGIDKTLARIEHNTSNPEETRARERFRRALDLCKAGHFAAALEQVDGAIANDGGPSFSHVSEFQALKGTLHMGSPANIERDVIDPAKAHAAFLAAAKYYPVKNVPDRPDRADLYYQAGLAAYAAGNPMLAIEAYRAAVEDYVVASNRYGRSPCFAQFQIARSALAIGDIGLVARHLERAIDLNWKLLVAVAADPDCIANQEIVEPVVSAYVEKTLPKARSELSTLCYVLVGGGPRNVVKMYQNVQAATLPDGLESDTSHSRLDSFEHFTRFFPDLNQYYWEYFRFYHPYPAGLTEGQAREIEALMHDDIGLVDIATAMERFNAKRALTEALERTRKFWDQIDWSIQQALEALADGSMPKDMLPGSRLPSVPEPRLSTQGGFLTRRRAKKAYEQAVAERKRIHAEGYAAINRDGRKIISLASRELPEVLPKCRKMVARSREIQKEAEMAANSLHPDRRWKVILPRKSWRGQAAMRSMSAGDL